MLSESAKPISSVRGRPYQIADLSIGSILDHSLYLIRDRFWFVLAVIFIFQVPFDILSITIAWWMGLEAIDPMTPNPTEMFTIYGAYGISGLLSILIIMPLSTGTIIHGIASHYSGRTTTLRESIRHALRRWPQFAVAHVLFTLGVTVGAFMCLIPGIFLQFYWLLFQPVVVLENAGPVKSLQRSGELIWGMMAMAFVLYLCVSLFYFPFGMAQLLFPGALAQFIAAHVSQGFASAANAVMITVLYCSARSRKESLDLDLQADRIAAHVPAESAL